MRDLVKPGYHEVGSVPQALHLGLRPVAPANLEAECLRAGAAGILLKECDPDEFVRAIRESRPPTPGFADGRAALVLAEAAVRSAATGSAIAVEDTDTATPDITSGALV